MDDMLPSWLVHSTVGSPDILSEPTDSDPACAPLDPRWQDFQHELAELTASLPPADDRSLVTVDYKPGNPALVETCLAALHRDGAVILSRAVAPELCDALYADLAPYVDANALHQGGFDSSVDSRRFDGINARTKHAHPIVSHPVLLQLCQAVLGQQALDQSPAQLLDLVRPDPRQTFETLPWALHLVELIQVGPGSPDEPTAAQGVHDDGGYCGYGFRKLFGITHTISTIWALSEFTEDCGATRVIRASHRWPPGRRPSGEETCSATMPKGSVVIYLSSTIHGSGANQTEQPRLGLNVDYNLAQLRGEETQLLSNPPELAKGYSRLLQKLCRYTRPGPNLGAHFGDFAHPATALQVSSRPLDWARGCPLPEWEGHTGRNAVLNGAVMSGSNNGLALMSEWSKDNPEAAAAERFSAQDSERWLRFIEDQHEWTQALPALCSSAGPIAVAATRTVRASADVASASGMSDTVPEQLVAALCRDGCVVLEDALSPQVCAAIISEMQSYVDSNERLGNGCRAGALLARSRSSWAAISHPDVMVVCDAVLGHQVVVGGPSWISHQVGSIRAENNQVDTLSWQLNVAHLHGDNNSATDVAGSSGAVGVCSGLRRSHDYLQLDLGNKVTVQLNVAWALEDISTDHAPQVVCGSHREPKHVMLAMPAPTSVPLRAGSCLIYTGHTFAALRAEPPVSPDAQQLSLPFILRAGYAPSVFFEEELQLLSNPPEIARHYPIPLQRLVGYDVYGGSFGYWGDRQHPIEAFNLESVRWADHMEGSNALPEHYAKLAVEEVPAFKKVLFQGSTVRPATSTRTSAPRL